MTPEQKAAYIQAQAVAAAIELEAMRAENADRESKGLSQAYDESSFHKLQELYCITHNDVISFFQD